MPEKVHNCVDDIEGIEGEDSKWAVCSNAIKEGSIINLLGIGNSLGKIREHHNPLDIPFGHEVKEVNNNVKDVNEGGLGSGRHKQAGSGSGGGQGGGADGGQGQGFGGGGPVPGELITFETTTPNILKQLLDTKVKECSCHKKN